MITALNDGNRLPLNVIRVTKTGIAQLLFKPKESRLKADVCG